MLTVRSIPGPTLASPQFTPCIPFASHGSRVYQFGHGACAAFDVAAESLVWTGAAPDAPQHQPRPREFQKALFYRPRVYPNLGVVVHLTQAPDGGLWALARRIDSGATAWDTRIGLPPPERWTDPEWLYEPLHTEELHASLAALTGRIVVTVQRNSRRVNAGRPIDTSRCRRSIADCSSSSSTQRVAASFATSSSIAGGSASNNSRYSTACFGSERSC